MFKNKEHIENLIVEELKKSDVIDSRDFEKKVKEIVKDVVKDMFRVLYQHNDIFNTLSH